MIICRTFRAGCDEFYRSIPDFGHDSEYAYQCCGFKALQSTRDGCVPSGRAVYLTMVREPFEHMLSSFFYRVSTRCTGRTTRRH